MKSTIKQLLFACFIFLEVLSIAVFAGVPERKASIYPAGLGVKKQKITVCITIARHRDCEGFGICHISIGSKIAPNNASGTLRLDDYNNNLVVFEFDKSTGLSGETYLKYFKSGTFIMEDDCPIPDDVAKGLGLTGSRVLATGNYRVVERNGLLQVSIPLK